MEKTVFFSNLINQSKEDGFSLFVSEGEKFEPGKPSASSQIKQRLAMVATAAVLGAVLGTRTQFIFGGINSSHLTAAEKSALIRDLKELQNNCDFIGVKLDSGPVYFKLAIDADDISDEALIGRFTIIHGQLTNFIKYAAHVLNNVKHGVYADVVTVFSSHKRAKLFNDHYAKKCSQWTFFKKTFTSPWVVDLEDEEIKQYRKHFDLFGKGEKQAAELFRR